MDKVDKTRDLIIQTSVALFNKKGYSQTSIQDIMNASGLPKGAIYRRFENKNEIALAAFEYSLSIIWMHFLEGTKSKVMVIDKIIAIFHVYQDAINSPPVAGGCPLLNTAIETDYGFPELHDKAAEALNQIILFIQSIIDEGICSKEFLPDLDSYSLASFLFSTFEGSVMASRLSLNNEHMHHSIKQIKIILQSYSAKN
ncbi:TetR family transcriptional regulator [Bacillus sp. AFS059628]|uniref:TetR/AcrR family transcriptional regulator n=1 Tax=Bacillus sp. AFS059628 TaxID=2033508 RepID=UPI000BF86426|nr:TetR/AcrR family transcriptional regulator [Bacillus sp. AFS059628]PFV82879.1 TetR family transcriptional regulator [Bacillus sp. AFS059628]